MRRKKNAKTNQLEGVQPPMKRVKMKDGILKMMKNDEFKMTEKRELQRRDDYDKDDGG